MKRLIILPAILGVMSAAWAGTHVHSLASQTSAHTQPSANPSTQPATQPAAPLPLFVGDKADEWKSYQAMHAYFLDRFIRSDGFGLRRIPGVGDELRGNFLYAEATRYRIGTVQLISLNGGKEPFIYQLNRIDASKNQLTEAPPGFTAEPGAQHIAVDKFETDAIREIQEGKDAVLTGAGERRELIGAIRSATACAKCHHVADGTLLGLFRYPLETHTK